jgi:hypothetical protein
LVVNREQGSTRSSSPPTLARCRLWPVACGWLLSLARPRRPPDRPRARGWVGLGIVFEFDNKPGKYPTSIERASLIRRQHGYDGSRHTNSYKTESNLPSLMPARSNPPSSSIERRRSAKPAGISFHLSHSPTFGHLRLARSALLGCGVAPFALGDQKAIPSSIHASTPPPPPPSSSIIPWDHPRPFGRLFPSIAYVSPSKSGSLRLRQYNAVPVTLHVRLRLSKGRRNPSSTISSGFSPDRGIGKSRPTRCETPYDVSLAYVPLLSRPAGEKSSPASSGLSRHTRYPLLVFTDRPGHMVR